jgi:malate dehydrogenase
MAAGKALDIVQAGAIERFGTLVSGHHDSSAVGGADVIVLADQGGRGEWSADDAARALRRVVRASASSVVICAGASQRETVERGVRELGFRREQLVGSAPEALASAVRALVALEVNGSPRDVGLIVAGVPPDHVVIPWEDATIAGISAIRLLTEPVRRKLAAQVTKLWPPGPLALASAAAKAVGTVLAGSRQVVCAFVAPDDSAGRRYRTGAIPVRLSVDGIQPVDLSKLNARDRLSLENATAL